MPTGPKAGSEAENHAHLVAFIAAGMRRRGGAVVLDVSSGAGDDDEACRGSADLAPLETDEGPASCEDAGALVRPS